MLGLETSCDETGIAVYATGKGILAENVYSQVELHAAYGGVVPELASRDHIRKISPLIHQTLTDGGVALHQLGGVAYTAGPGLAGALMVGALVGRTIAWALDIPALGVHHMEAHLLAPLLGETDLDFPFVALLVSGGHTQLVLVESFGSYALLGESLDDAVGEAFDKTAQLLGLGYPGGPAISQLADEGSRDRFTFPRPMLDRPGLDFSFSGLKTAVQVTVKKLGDPSRQVKADIAASFQEAVVDSLVRKAARAIQETRCKRLVLAGGVAANKRLREALAELPASVYYPSLELCTDNGAMIAFAGHERLKRGQIEPLAVTTRTRWSLTTLS